MGQNPGRALHPTEWPRGIARAKTRSSFLHLQVARAALAYPTRPVTPSSLPSTAPPYYRERTGLPLCARTREHVYARARASASARRRAHGKSFGERSKFAWLEKIFRDRTTSFLERSLYCENFSPRYGRSSPVARGPEVSKKLFLVNNDSV